MYVRFGTFGRNEGCGFPTAFAGRMVIRSVHKTTDTRLITAWHAGARIQKGCKHATTQKAFVPRASSRWIPCWIFRRLPDGKFAFVSAIRDLKGARARIKRLAHIVPGSLFDLLPGSRF